MAVATEAAREWQGDRDGGGLPASDAERRADGEALESAVAEFAAGETPFALGAVPSGPPGGRPATGREADGDGLPRTPSATVRSQAESVDGEVEEAELAAAEKTGDDRDAAAEARVAMASAAAVATPASVPAQSPLARGPARVSIDVPASEQGPKVGAARRLRSLSGSARPAGRP